MKNISNREIAIVSALAAVSAVVQLIHIGYQSPQWGMWIDIVAISWIMAFFLYGVRTSFIASLLGALVITLFAPDTWLGASMKWIATLPMWLSLYLWMIVRKQNLSQYQKINNLIVPIVIGLILRSVVILPLNYYFAIPIWTGMTSEKAISAIPWFVIVGFNVLQGILDVIFAWIIVFRFRLSRFASWQE